MTKPNVRTLHKNRRGTAAVEFALVMPVLMMFLVGIVGYSLFLATQIAVVMAASEGARASVAGLSSTERSSLAQTAAQAVLQHYAPLILLNNATVSAQQSASNSGMFQVTVNYAIPNSPLGRLMPLPSSASFTSSVGNGGY
jgi:Flp pilus assembly protein TadG